MGDVSLEQIKNENIDLVSISLLHTHTHTYMTHVLYVVVASHFDLTC
jgi:methanogenic corrinoid protein MtbC1